LSSIINELKKKKKKKKKKKRKKKRKFCLKKNLKKLKIYFKKVIMFKNINKYSEDQYSNNNLDTEYNNQ